MLIVAIALAWPTSAEEKTTGVTGVDAAPTTRAAGVAALPADSVVDPATIVARTDSIAEAIDAATPNLSKVERELEGADLGGGSGALEAYFQRGTLRRIETVRFFEDHNESHTFYVSGGDLVLAADTRSSNTNNRSDEHRDRLYFANGKVVRWTDEQGRSIALNTADARSRQASLVQSFTTYRNAIRGETPAKFTNLINTDSTDIAPSAYLPFDFTVPAKSKCSV